MKNSTAAKIQEIQKSPALEGTDTGESGDRSDESMMLTNSGAAQLVARSDFFSSKKFSSRARTLKNKNHVMPMKINTRG